MRYLFSLICLLIFQTAMAQSPPVNFSTKNGSKWEKGVMNRMQKMLQEYDLSKWIFTDTVIVEDNVIPHSHPVLTLSTRKATNDDILSTFIHEQIHWHCVNKDAQLQKAVVELKSMYKEVPVGRPDGARDEFSTYLHLVVCYLEYEGMISLVGQERATVVMESMNHYKWIYKQVLEQPEKLAKVIKKHGLNL